MRKVHVIRDFHTRLYGILKKVEFYNKLITIEKGVRHLLSIVFGVFTGTVSD